MTEDSQKPVEAPSKAGNVEDNKPGEGFPGLFPEDAFFSPDDPIARPEGEIPDDALFSPDDPLKREPPEDGVVTHLSGRADRVPDKPRSLVWRVRLTADLLERLAKDLREQGLEALKVHPESERMDAIIRSFVAGYLVGQMGDEDKAR